MEACSGGSGNVISKILWNGNVTPPLITYYVGYIYIRNWSSYRKWWEHCKYFTDLNLICNICIICIYHIIVGKWVKSDYIYPCFQYKSQYNSYYPFDYFCFTIYRSISELHISMKLRGYVFFWVVYLARKIILYLFKALCTYFGY